MTFKMDGEIELPAERELVWNMLNDPGVLKECIPGCEELSEIDGGFKATVKVRIGPVAARFAGQVTLEDLDPPNGYRISGAGEGGIAGFAKGAATVQLREIEGGTILSYTVDAQIGGKLAQLGQRLINGAAKKLADQFFQSISDRARSLC